MHLHSNYGDIVSSYLPFVSQMDNGQQCPDVIMVPRNGRRVLGWKPGVALESFGLLPITWLSRGKPLGSKDR